ncbi:uncharacterized protein KD926_009139 [Aspergillus affinis]|uniref:uncharacterized protein n=1 Tax=Aspergillus affinis TaxID=1070780 RepID=UPI0022FE1F2F|nr:uncharacterized protein KD926_009139 [Aspergillus affinis]KAI9039669.1 hypothetical protein KD926_009139 [Aspergillus affinis]
MNLALSVGFLHLFYALAYVFIPDDCEAITDSSVTPDNLNIVIRSTQENVTFDLTLHATSRALYYGGGGAYAYLNDPTYNWALPACETSGNISLPRSSSSGALETISINSSASFTWYDRMWGAPALLNKNSTYFNLFFDNSELFLSTYAVSRVDPPLRSLSSNIRRRNESVHVFAPLDIFTPDAHEIWTSPRTGQIYPQKWKLGIESRGILEIQSVSGDQETVSPGWYGTTYLGFVTFTGVFDEQEVTGFGAVEMRYVLPLPQVSQ